MFYCFLQFTAPRWKGVYTFTVWLRSDSYVGFDQQKDIKLDVKEAPAEITEHPQWDFENSENEEQVEDDGHESEYATDEDLPEDDSQILNAHCSEQQCVHLRQAEEWYGQVRLASKSVFYAWPELIFT